MAVPFAKEEGVDNKVHSIVLTDIANFQSQDKNGKERPIESNSLAQQGGTQSETDHYYPEGGFGWCVLAGTFVVGFW